METVQVVGAGGIGCAVGYSLLAAGVPVTFVEANPRKVLAGLREGVTVRGRGALGRDSFPSAPGSQSGGETVLLCTKSYYNGRVLERIPAGTRLIPIQNGFDGLIESHGHEFEGIASFVSQCEPDRPHIRITRRGDLHLGRHRSGSRLTLPAWLVDGMARTDLLRLVQVADIGPYKYAKLMYNAAISPIAAAAGIDNGALLSVPSARRLFFALLEENYNILAAARLEVGRIGPFRPATVAWILRRKWLARALARAFEPSLRGTYCSMAGEIARGRTEIDHYNGRLIRLARQTGTPCPLNQAVYDLVSRMTTEHATPNLQVWRQVAAA